MRTHSTEERTRRAASFNEDAERYNRARPTYPPEVFDRLWDLAGLGPAPRVVEVGCGTGQASVSLAARGAQLTCIELGDNMATIARRKLSAFATAKVFVSKFEEWDPAGESFDLLFAAASWHWIPPDVRYRKAASVLRPGGHVAVVHSDHFYPEGFDPLFFGIQDVYGIVTGSRKEVKARELPAQGEFDGNDHEQIAELERTGAFDQPRVARVLWHFKRTADAYIDLLATYSDHWALEPEKRRRLFEGIHCIIADSPTGTIRKHYLTSILVARRIA